MATTLLLTPKVWAQLQYLAHATEVEVCAFGVVEDPTKLLVTELVLPTQEGSIATTRPLDSGIADLQLKMLDRGLEPRQWHRVWIHTHPSNVSQPSPQDWQTFDNIYGKADWGIMMILPRDGDPVAWLRLSVTDGPSAMTKVPVMLDYSVLPDFSGWEYWAEELLAALTEVDEDWGFGKNDKDTKTVEWYKQPRYRLPRRAKDEDPDETDSDTMQVGSNRYRVDEYGDYHIVYDEPALSAEDWEDYKEAYDDVFESYTT